MTESTPAKIEIKNIKHTFTSDERNDLGGQLARSIGGLRGIEAEFDQVKASYKAKVTEAEAKIDNLSTGLVNGFEMRNERCRVNFRPKDREKDYVLESDFEKYTAGKLGGALTVVLTEPMAKDDYQAELVLAESKFDAREEINLFQPTDTDRGVLIVGRFAGKWYSALRVKIGKLTLDERLDSEQRAFKLRPDAVRHAVKRVKDWAKENLQKHADGFIPGFDAAFEAQKDRAE